MRPYLYVLFLYPLALFRVLVYPISYGCETGNNPGWCRHPLQGTLTLTIHTYRQFGGLGDTGVPGENTVVAGGGGHESFIHIEPWWRLYHSPPSLPQGYQRGMETLTVGGGSPLCVCACTSGWNSATCDTESRGELRIVNMGPH